MTEPLCPTCGNPFPQESDVCPVDGTIVNVKVGYVHEPRLADVDSAPRTKKKAIK